MNDGGPDFHTTSAPPRQGMSLRAYFAGQILAGFLSDSTLTGSEASNDPTQWPLLPYVKASVMAADALIAELNKESK